MVRCPGLNTAIAAATIPRSLAPASNNPLRNPPTAGVQHRHSNQEPGDGAMRARIPKQPLRATAPRAELGADRVPHGTG